MIDFHQHIRHYGRTLDHVLAHQDAHGVQYAVILPIDGTASEREVFPSEEALDAARRYPNRLVAFFHVDPRKPDALEQIRRSSAAGYRGFGENKVPLAVDAPEQRAIYALCADLGWPVLLHFEYGMYNYNFEAFEQVLRDFPQTTFIGHAQAFWANISADAPRDPEAPGYTAYPSGQVVPGGLTDRWLSEFPNLYGDLSAGSGLNGLTRDPTFTKGFLERHQQKLLWATDCPCRDGKGDWGRGKVDTCYAERSLPTLRALAPTPAIFEQITDRNARRLLKLT